MALDKLIASYQNLRAASGRLQANRPANRESEAMETKCTMVSKSSLNIDPAYQRTEELNVRLIDKIVKDYDPALFGLPVVARRKDGSLWVIDGQHRVTAARGIDSLSKIPVMVVDVNDSKEEADLFVALNTRRTSVSSYGRFHAAVAANHKMETEINDFLGSIGMDPGPKGKKGRLTCIGEVVSIWKKNKKFAKLSLMQVSEILGGRESPNVHLVRAIFYLAWKTDGASLRPNFTAKFTRIGQEDIIQRAELREYHRQPLEGALRLARIANTRQTEKIDVTPIVLAIGNGEEIMREAA